MTICGRTRNLTFFDRRPVNLVFERPVGFVNRMALHACRIRKWFVQFRRSMTRHAPIVRVIIPNVVHSADFREHRPEHAVIGVAHVTTLIAEIRIFAVNRRQRLAVRIRRIICVNGHRMARSAEFSFRRHLEVRNVSGHRRRYG